MVAPKFTPDPSPDGGLRIPREHGAWSVLVTSLCAGAAVGGGLTRATIILWIAVLAGFIGWANAVAWWKDSGGHPIGTAPFRWAAALLSAALAGCAWLVFGAGYLALPWLLSTVAGCALWLSLRRQHIARSIWAELAGIAGLSALAAASQYTSAGRLSRATFGIWLVCLLVFIGSLLHVRFVVRHAAARRQRLAARLRAGLPSGLYHLAALGVLGLAATVQLTPPIALLLLAPSVAKAWWAILIPSTTAPPQIRRIGRIELVYAALFVLLALVTARAWPQ